MARTPDVGDVAPDFELEGTEGTFRLSDQRGRRVVLLFYPGDFTPVCTRQFCSYAERADDMSSLDAVVVGISGQDLDSHVKFVDTHGIPVALLADTDRSVAKAYGASAPLLGTRRGVVVIDEDGRIAHRDVSGLGLGYADVDSLRDILDALPARTA
jgi:thioredoxin-dependent peroxiredoxin